MSQREARQAFSEANPDYEGTASGQEIRAFLRRQGMSPEELDQQQIRALTKSLGNKLADPMSGINLYGMDRPDLGGVRGFDEKAQKLMELLGQYPDYSFDWKQQPGKQFGNLGMSSQAEMMQRLGVGSPTDIWAQLQGMSASAAGPAAGPTPHGPGGLQSYLPPRELGDRPGAGPMPPSLPGPRPTPSPTGPIPGQQQPPDLQQQWMGREGPGGIQSFLPPDLLQRKFGQNQANPANVNTPSGAGPLPGPTPPRRPSLRPDVLNRGWGVRAWG